MSPLAVLLLLLGFALWGVHFEAYEAVVNAQFNGALTGSPMGDMYVYSHLFTNCLFPTLYLLAPSFPFYPTLTFAIISISTLLFSIKVPKQWWLAIVLVLIAFGANFFWISNLRICILTTCFGLAIAFLNPKNKSIVTIGLLLAAYGSSVRYEGGVLVILLTLGFCIGTNTFNLRLHKFTYIGAIMLCLFVVLKEEQVAKQNPYLDRLHNLTYLTSVSDTKLQKTDGNADNALFIEALNMYFVSDTAFFNKMASALPQSQNLLWQKSKQLFTLNENILHTWQQLWQYCQAEILTSLLLIIFVIATSHKAWRMLLANLVLFGTLTYILAATKAEIRFASPYLLFIALVNFLVLYKNKSQIQPALLSLCIMPFAILSMQKLSVIKEDQQKVEKQNQKYIATLNALPHTIIALNMNSVNIFNTSVLANTGFAKNKKIMPIDMGDYTCITSIHQHLNKQFGINSMDLKKTYAYLSNNKEVIYLSSEERTIFIAKYLKQLYGLDIHFEPLPMPAFQIDGNKIWLYQLKQMSQP